MAVGSLALVSQRTGEAVADRVELAVTRRTRRTGLLGRTGMGAGSALVLAPCAAVHMMFMRFPIDVLFVDADGRVLRIVPGLRPWRIAAAPGAHAAVEMPAGTLRSRVEIGDRLHLRTGAGDAVPLHARDLRRAVSATGRSAPPAVAAAGWTRFGLAFRLRWRPQDSPTPSVPAGADAPRVTPSALTDRTC